MDNKFNFKKEPMWEFETCWLLVNNFSEKNETSSEISKKSYLTEEYMSICSENYHRYKAAVSEELITLFNSEYQILEQFFKSNPTKNSIMLDFVLEYIMKDYDNILDEEIDEIMLEILKNISNDFIVNSNKKFFNLKNIISVIDMLNQTNIEDNIKMQIINYYNDRYNLSKIAINLFKHGAEILKKHFIIIADDFYKAVEISENMQNFHDACSEIIGLQLPQVKKFDVYTIIFSFNQLSVHSPNDECKNYMCFIGMYVFELYKKKMEWNTTNIKIVTDLKALSDATRYKILLLLSKKVMYLQELANELDLTPATISHHMNVLLRSNLISITMDAEGSRKIYYEINKLEMNKLCDLINELTK